MEGETVLQQYHDTTGCRTLFDTAGERPKNFERFLRSVLDRWNPPISGGLPLVISGMASSTIGWKELPYSPLPLALDASTLKYERISWDAPSWVSGTFLISGAAGLDDMMRGEETEAIGLFRPAYVQPCRIVLPGTHSKHLFVRNGAISGLQTFMTGELFDVLCRYSILKATTDPKEANLFDENSFLEGLSSARQFGLAASLFKVRSRSVLQKMGPAANTAFLSGLLIGSELTQASAMPTLVGGAPDLRKLYLRALKENGADILSSDDSDVELSVPRAHAMFLKTIW